MTALAIVLGLALSPEPSPPDANPHFDAAVVAWKEQRWAAAAAAFSRAYELDPRPEYVFARAQALRFSGECDQAIEGYREFIALDPPKGAIEEAREHIVACGGDPDATPRPEPTPEAATEPGQGDRAPGSAVVERPHDTGEASHTPRRWWRDPAGHTLGWTGLAAAAVGTGFLFEGLARRERGERAPDEQSYRDARRGGASLLHAGIPLVSVGGALVIGAIIRFAVVARERPRGDRGAFRRGRSHAHGRRGPQRPAGHLGVVPFGVGIAWAP